MGRLADYKTAAAAIVQATGGDAGVTLIEMMMALGVASIGMFIAASYYKNLTAAQRHLDQGGDRIAIHDMLDVMVDCKGTYAANSISPVSCALTGGGTMVKLVQKHSGAVLVSNNSGAPSTIGTFTVRARCVGIGSTSESPGIHVEVARPLPGTPSVLTATSPASFNRDPLDSSTLDWANPKDALFIGHAELCNADFVVPACPPASADYGGLWPITAGNEDDPAQSSTALVNLPTAYSYTDDRGKLVCRYYAPLVHGGNPTHVGPGPGTFNFDDAADELETNAHYGQLIHCPPRWRGLTGGVSCDAISTTGNNSGGVMTTSNTYANGSFNDWVYSAQCIGFYDPASQHEAVDNAAYIDCSEP